MAELNESDLWATCEDSTILEQSTGTGSAANAAEFQVRSSPS